MNKVFTEPKYQNKQGYSGFPQDHLINFTSVAGYLLPVYFDFLDPGDKVRVKALMRSRTQPFTKPAMATCIERLEWFAVPIDQIYKPFSTKFYGISDVASDLLPQKGYNDTLPYVTLTDVHNWLKMLPTSFDAQSAIPASVPTFSEAKRLLDCLGWPSGLGDGEIPGSYVFSGSNHIFFAAAYQKIYYDHYRLTDWEENDVQAYNFDSFNQNMNVPVGASASSGRFPKLFQLHKRPYTRDYFTSIKPSPLVGSQDVSMSGVDLGKVEQWLTGLSGLKTGSPASSNTYFPDGGNTAVSDTNPTTVKFAVSSGSGSATAQGLSTVVSSAFTPPNIRSMFAVEKLLEVTRRAKKHYDMQTLAHFGVEVPKGLSGECFKLGSQESFLQIGDVVSSADTISGNDGLSLGALAGTGKSSNSGSFNSDEPITFEAKCHCVLMGIYSIEPILNYKQDGNMRINSMTAASSFFKPEFDDLGEQPVYRGELFKMAFDPVGEGASQADNSNYVIGWNKRYMQLKAKYNRSFGGVTSSYFSEWALNRQSLSANVAFSRNFFYVWPNDMNNILQVDYSGTGGYSTMYSDDYFINQIYFDVSKSSKKSVFGVPNL